MTPHPVWIPLFLVQEGGVGLSGVAAFSDLGPELCAFEPTLNACKKITFRQWRGPRQCVVESGQVCVE
ncbi:hypothetical protein AMELA_G00089370 [Ameiurus melas]|uniref:Uncharacterized protein n=1 Tax=Ameiurus melas TaxID=219545 RepID=A0A7J6AXN6_AMEME|nr:hypothetical protein AMELA_G00089370 [Ameiurus melas]